MNREILNLSAKFLEDKGLTEDSASPAQLSDAKAYEACYQFYRNTLKVLPENAEIASKVWVQKYALHNKEGICLESTPADMWDRVANALTEEEFLTNPTLLPENRAQVFSMFRNVLDGYKYTPQGSGLFALGNEYVKSSASNCFVLPSPEDSLDSIFETAKLMAKIYAFRGGIGIDISNLRPYGASTNNAARTSTGAASFMDFYSYVTGMIGQCIEETQPVLTRRGYIPIKEVLAGDSVWTRKGWVKNLNTLDNGIKPVYRLTTKRGLEITATDNHIFLSGDNTEKQLGDFKVGDSIITMPGTPINDIPNIKLNTDIVYDQGHGAINGGARLNDVTLPDELTEDLAYFVGYSFGDGYVERDKFNEPVRLDLACSQDYPAIETKLSAIATNKFSYIPHSTQGDGAVNKVSIHSKKLGLYLEQNGLLKQKHNALIMPESIKRSKTSVQMAFISGYFDADGYASGAKKGYVIASVHMPILKDMQQMLMAAGIVSHITTEQRTEKFGTEDWKDLHSLSITGAYSQTLAVSLLSESVKVSSKAFVAKRDSILTPFTAKDCGIKYNKYSFVPDNTQNMSARCFGLLQEQNVINDNITILDFVASIEYVGEARVYDLQLESEHLYVSAGMIVHNSGRRGALMLTMRVDHPDILRFIEMKRDLDKQPFFDDLAECGIDINDFKWSGIADRLKSTSYANVSVRLTDKFMEAVKNDTDFELYFDYDESSAYPRYIEKVRAKDIWDKLMHSAWESAEPGILNWDHVLRESPADCYVNLTDVSFTDPQTGETKNVSYSFRTLSTNPCISGDSYVLTDSGYRQVSSLLDKPWTAIVNGNPYPATPFWKTGNKPVYALTLANGAVIKTTEDHQLLLESGEWCQAKDTLGKQLHTNQQDLATVADSTNTLFQRGWVLGSVLGDGYFTETSGAALSFWGHSAQVLAQYASSCLGRKWAGQISDNIRIKINSNKDLIDPFISLNSKEIKPALYEQPREFISGFLSGLLDADGSVQGTAKKGYSIRIAQSNLALLQHCQRLFAFLGIQSRVYANRRFETIKYWKQGNKKYTSKAQHELVISSNDLVKSSKCINFISPDKAEKLANILATTSVYNKTPSTLVKSIKLVGVEAVYDCTVEHVHCFDLNGIIAHNCGEVPLSGGDSCCLGTFYLPAFVTNPYTSAAQFDWDAFTSSVKIGVRAQDNIKNWDARILPLEINRVSAMLGRRISVGTHGLADCMAMLGLKYDSDDALTCADNIYKVLKNTVYMTSVNLAKEKGAFQVWDWETEKDNPFLKRLDPDVLKAMKKHGRRNISLLTNAPTGSMSVLSRNCSSGIEPIFMKSYTRNVKIPGTNEFESYTVYHQGIEDCLQAGGDPSVYVEAGDIDPQSRVALQAVIQSHIDHAISVTTNLKNETPVETIDLLYRGAFEKGCKGFTVYRDGCRTGVLNAIKVAKPHKSLDRPKTTNIDIHKVKYRDKQWAVLVGRVDNGPIEVFAGIEEDTPLPNKYHRAELTKKSRGHYSLTVYLSEDEDDIIKINNIGARFPLPEGMTLTRFISLALKNGVSVADICEQLTKSSNSMFDYPAVLNRVLKNYITEDEYTKKIGDKPCPDCSKTLKFRKQDGCMVEYCEHCGYHYSKCN